MPNKCLQGNALQHPLVPRSRCQARLTRDVKVNKYRGIEMPRTVKEIEQAVEQLTPDQLAEFRAWYEQFDAAAWDRQIEEDIVAGKLDALADAAIADHKAGRTKKL